MVYHVLFIYVFFSLIKYGRLGRPLVYHVPRTLQCARADETGNSIALYVASAVEVREARGASGTRRRSSGRIEEMMLLATVVLVLISLEIGDKIRQDTALLLSNNTNHSRQ